MPESSDVHNRGRRSCLHLFDGVCFLRFLHTLLLYILVLILVKTSVDPNAVSDKPAGPIFKIADVKEPWVSTPEIVEYGHKQYKMNCATCHGDTGKGDGPAVGSNPKPRNFVEGKWTQGNGTIAHLMF